MQRIRLENPVKVGWIVQNIQGTLTTQGVTITFEWGDMVTPAPTLDNPSPEPVFVIGGSGSFGFPNGPDLDALIAASNSRNDLDANLIGLLARGTETAPALKGTVEEVAQ